MNNRALLEELRLATAAWMEAYTAVYPDTEDVDTWKDSDLILMDALAETIIRYDNAQRAVLSRMVEAEDEPEDDPTIQHEPVIEEGY